VVLKDPAAIAPAGCATWLMLYTFAGSFLLLH
jgi:hypothetical protein